MLQHLEDATNNEAPTFLSRPIFDSLHNRTVEGRDHPAKLMKM